MAFSLQKLFGKVREVERKRDSERVQTYRELVNLLADGADAPVDDVPGVDEVLQILEDVGRSVDQLAADVDLVQKRRAWKRQADEAESLLAEHNRLVAENDATEAKFKEEFAALRQRFDQTMSDLRGKLAQVDARRDAAQTASNRLLETSDHYKAICQTMALRAKIVQPIEANGMLRRERDRVSAGVVLLKRRLALMKQSDPALQNEQAVLRAMETQLARLDEKIAAGAAQAAEIGARVDSMTAEALAV